VRRRVRAMSTPRLATVADLPALTRLINTAYLVEAFFIRGDRTTERELRTRLDGAHSCFLVVDDETGDRLVGAVYLERRGDSGHFAMLSVHPDRQGTGLGRLLVEASEAHFRAAGCTAVSIDVVNLRTELPPFYARFGYEPAGTIPFPAPAKLTQPVHLLVMRKALA